MNRLEQLIISSHMCTYMYIYIAEDDWLVDKDAWTGPP